MISRRRRATSATAARSGHRTEDPGSTQVDEHGGGTVSAPMAIMILAAVVAVGLAVDGVRAAQGVARADAVAEEAARAGGQAYDPVSLVRGRAVVEPAAAVTAARAYLDAAGATGTVQIVGPDRIRVDTELTQPTILLGLIGRPELTSTGSAEAILLPVAPGTDGTQP
jgi:hypothetical protein